MVFYDILMTGPRKTKKAKHGINKKTFSLIWAMK